MKTLLLNGAIALSSLFNPAPEGVAPSGYVDNVYGGNPEVIVASATQYGEASWYGPGFHGRTTANGEQYNQNALTAAHPTHQFGCRVRVTNQANGLSVDVRINDRGPFVGGRIIDVSYAAAQALLMVDSGVAQVSVAPISGC